MGKTKNRPLDTAGTDTHSLTFSEKTWQVIDRLAQVNTDGNRSRLLALLAHRADLLPEQFGFRDEALPMSVTQEMKELQDAQQASA